ncbi:ArnT family glycosyltransferase, partial [Thermodesulfobacteriota bacterium]
VVNKGSPHVYGIDFPLVGMVSMSLALAAWCEGFAKRWCSALLGVVCGIGMLTKGQFGIFLAGPIAFALILGWRQAWGDDEKGTRAAAQRLLNFSLFLFLTLLVSSPWWYGNIGELAKRLVVNKGSPHVYEFQYFFVDTAFLPMCKWLYHAMTVFTFLSPPFFLVFLVSLAGFVGAQRQNRELWILTLGIVIPYLAFSAFFGKFPRYFIPVLPAVAVLTAVGIQRIPSRRLRGYATCILLVIGLVHHLTLSYGIDVKGVDVFARPSRQSAEMKMTDAVASVLETSGDRKGPLFIGIVSTQDKMDHMMYRLRYLLRERENGRRNQIISFKVPREVEMLEASQQDVLIFFEQREELYVRILQDGTPMLDVSAGGRGVRETGEHVKRIYGYTALKTIELVESHVLVHVFSRSAPWPADSRRWLENRGYSPPFEGLPPEWELS